MPAIPALGDLRQKDAMCAGPAWTTQQDLFQANTDFQVLHLSVLFRQLWSRAWKAVLSPHPLGGCCAQASMGDVMCGITHFLEGSATLVPGLSTGRAG